MASKPNFFVSTQSVHGNFMKSDMDTYLSTIRRMIQQKCKDTQELIQSIRRNRIGDGGHVTPNEFRFTLIKFGVILPQALVDKIFAVFDGDRSGTMDFDEFAMWIMNSEFMHRDTSGDNQAKLVLDSQERERLRQKLIVCIQENQQSFAHMKRSVSFLEFVSEVNRKQMPITEKEARSIFVIFDPKDTGFMDTKRLRHWAQSGALDTPPPSAQPPSQLLKQRPLPTLAQSIAKVCGTNTLLLLQSIQHLPRGAGIRVPLEEFRRCLLSNGLGQNVMDTEELYSILCGGADALGRGASIDALYDALVVPAPRPEQIVSMKPEKPQFARTSHAHRRLREALRKTHKLIKAELEAADKGESGWVECTVLHSLLIKHAMPLSYQDFRYITMQFKTEENATKVNWQQFLAAYQPTKAPHMLDSVSASIPEAAPFFGGSLSSSASALAPVSSPVKQRPHGVPSVPGSATGAGLGLGPESAAIDPASAHKPLSTVAKAKLALTAPKTVAKTFSMRDEVSSKDQDPHSEMRRIWQAVLRECHRSDPDRSGCVSRMAFVNALEGANLNKTMTPQSMARLADKYTTQMGLIDYLSCFRTYLTAISQKPAPEPSAKAEDNKARADVRCHHPWDFDYKRSRSAGPYWAQAATLPRDFAKVSEQSVAAEKAVPSLHKSIGKLTGEEISALKSKYSDKCNKAAKRVYDQIYPTGQWQAFRNELRKNQVNSQRGCILTKVLYSLLEKWGVKLSIALMHSLVTELRGTGNQDVVRYEEMTRLCSVNGDAKNSGAN